jgi:hypothetical protein
MVNRNIAIGVRGAVAAVATVAALSAFAPVPGVASPATDKGANAAEGGRYCERPNYGWYCLYADSDQRGWSIGKTACGDSDLPRWFWDYTSSWWDYQKGGAHVDAYTYDDRARLVYLFSTRSSESDGGVRGNVPISGNDQADHVANRC